MFKFKGNAGTGFDKTGKLKPKWFVFCFVYSALRQISLHFYFLFYFLTFSVGDKPEFHDFVTLINIQRPCTAS